MFAVIFETSPLSERFGTYLDIAQSLRPELETVPGFIENIRYKSLTKPGWILSLSIWQDEKALVRWRTNARHHEAQEKGRGAILDDYHLRVGQIVGGGGKGWDAEAGGLDEKERFDKTEVGGAQSVVLVDGLSLGEAEDPDLEVVTTSLGLNLSALPAGLATWDVFEAVLEPGNMILLSSWTDEAAAGIFSSRFEHSSDLRYRLVRTVRDYGKYDRREAPLYYKDVPGRETLH